MECFQKSLTIDQKIYGEEHANIAIHLTDIGRIYKDLGNHKVNSLKILV